MSIKKIVVIGPESTGKSTLSEGLAKALHTVWVPEYARQYLTDIGRPYTADDLEEMARGQLALEDILMRQANKYLICDTDLYVIKVWAEHKYGTCPRWILEEIATRPYDCYLLTGIDTAWEDDPLRENPGHWRQYFYNTYHDIVMQSGLPWAAIKGNEQERLAKALAVASGL